MGKYSERIINHRIYTLSKDLIKAVDKARALHFTDESKQEELVRLSHGAEYIHSIIQGLNPYLTDPTDLDQLSEYIDTIISNLEQFVSKKNGSYADSANSSLDKCIEIIAHLLPRNPKSLYRGLPKLIEDTNTRVKEHQDFVLKQQDMISKTTERLEEKIIELEKTLENQLINLKLQHENEINNLKIDLNKQKYSLSEEINNLISVLKTSINGSEEDRVKWFSEYNKQLDEYFKNKQTSIKEFSDEMIQKFKILENQVIDIVGATGNAAMAGEFKILAHNELIKADQFQKWAIFAWLGLAITAIIILLEQFVHNWYGRPSFPGGWGSVGTRLFVSLSIAALAGYLMRQADRHRTVFRWASRLAAEISSMGAFLAPLEEEQQQAIRAAVALRIFGQSSDMEPSDKKEALVGPDLPSVEGLSKVLAQVLEVTKLTKN